MRNNIFSVSLTLCSSQGNRLLCHRRANTNTHTSIRSTPFFAYSTTLILSLSPLSKWLSLWWTATINAPFSTFMSPLDWELIPLGCAYLSSWTYNGERYKYRPWWMVVNSLAVVRAQKYQYIKVAVKQELISWNQKIITHNLTPLATLPAMPFLPLVCRQTTIISYHYH